MKVSFGTLFFNTVPLTGSALSQRGKADSHIACRVTAVPLPCHAVPLRVYNVSFLFDLHSAAVSDSHLTCRAHALLWPCRSSQGHGTARPSRDGLWATCPRSASSAEFLEDCYQKHTSSSHNDPYPRLQRVVAACYKKDDLLNCWTSSSDISGYHAELHEGHGTVGAGQGRGMACVN
jgi:hypothetical protein